MHLDSIETYIQWSLGKSLYANSDYKKALEAFQKVNQTENRPVIYSDINMLIGDTEFNIKNWQKSKSYYQKQLELKNNSKTTITQCKLKIAQIENITGNKQRAITLLKKISENPKDEDIELKATAAFELSKILAILNKHEESNIYLNKYITLQKSVSLTATKNLISTLEKRQNNVEKEQRIELLYKDSEIQTTLYNKENENNRILLIGIFLISLLLIITLWLFISGIKKNQQLSIKNFEIQEKNEELNTMNSELHMINKQLIESEEKLMKEINAQDKLLSIVAHDLKSPLVALKSILGLYRMSKTKFTPENMEIAINRVENELGSVLELLNNLLSWALNHRGNMHINLNTSNVSEIIENTIALFGEQSSIKNITLNKSIIPNLQWTVDSNMLQFIVRNFITNAIKFTPDNGRITISTTAENNILFISVKDTGIGLNPEQLKNLSRFTEITPAKGTRGERGSGIGLILCNEFAQKLNGKLNIVSQPGKGSTFSLLLYQ
ncbi:MAG: HAMP domain-containing sensor histidine kinase [Salinivirgaceae bacterium]|nr:HAMP domain-containing sensor histidine kinase [Salinivirgaceae bacterium]